MANKSLLNGSNSDCMSDYTAPPEMGRNSIKGAIPSSFRSIVERPLMPKLAFVTPQRVQQDRSSVDDEPSLEVRLFGNPDIQHDLAPNSYTEEPGSPCTSDDWIANEASTRDNLAGRRNK